MVYEILMMGDALRGKAVRLYLDNSSAVAWFGKMRSAVPFAITLMQILSVYCGIMDVGLFPAHIPGVENVRADYKSRSLSLSDSQGGPSEVTRDAEWWVHLSRTATCRTLLLQLAKSPSPMPSDEVLKLVSFLLPGRGSGTVER